MTIELKLMSEDGACLREIDVPKLKAAQKTKGEIWHDVLGRLGRAQIVDVEIDGRPLLADAETGSLYHPDSLRCLTSVELSIRY